MNSIINFKRKIALLIIFSLSLTAEYHAKIYKIAPRLKEKMIKRNSWHKGCPVGIEDLRYLRLTYINFKGEDSVGELIVHKSVARDVVSVMRNLYNISYPINQMRLISDFNGNDWQSIEADNTSAFNCRKATGSKKWSKHSYGKAIDINPIENPYISKKGYISHRASQKYRYRRHQNSTPADRAVLLPNDKATHIFKQHGFFWGGDWKTIKDYQHFAK